MNQLKEIFAEALERRGAERATYLDQACGADAALRLEVEAFLAAAEKSDAFVESSDFDERVGSLVGRYKLLEQIGEGGFGVVFMAEQEQPIRRRVALKIIKLGMDTHQVIARFEAERQALAIMDHPNIAKVLDAGATDSGRRFFAMELVKGIPITRYCDEKKHSTRDRLELFVSVCSAVQHAHQKGIIHRDLKPTNVLVTMHDDKAVAKVIDFGVAKATGTNLTEKTLFTEFRQMIGTPAYMSPEQAQMSGLDIDTRSDIYSLGVLLYELLTGTTPFDARSLMSAAFEEMRRIISEVDPPAPSVRLTTMTETLPSAAANRSTDPRKLGTMVRGELDWIVMRCLEKDRSRRYQTASALAEDVQHYLADLPVQARAATRVYRLKKFIRRNRVTVLASAAVTLALIAGLTIAMVGFVKARRQEQIARTEAAWASQTSQFLQDMLKGVDPAVARGRDTALLREILDKSAERVDRDLKDQPRVAGELCYTLGVTYDAIGDKQHAIAMLQHSVESYRLVLGEENPKVALALCRLGSVQSFTGDIAAGRANGQRGVEIARKCADRETLATCLFLLGSSFSHFGLSSAQGEPYVREAVALRRRENDPVALADAMYWHARFLEDQPDGIKAASEALELHRRHLGADHPKAINDLFLLGQKLLTSGEIEEAEPVLRETWRLFEKVIDKHHPYRAIVLRYLSQALALQGKSDEAERVVRAECDADPTNPRIWILLGAIRASRIHWREAIEPFSRAIELDSGDQEVAYVGLAVTCAALEEREKYREVCHRILQLPPDYSTPTAVLLMPLEGADFERACQLADDRPSDDAWLMLAKSLAEFRRGRFQSSYDWAGRVLDTHSTRQLPAACYLQAFALAKLGRVQDARTALTRGDQCAQATRSLPIFEFWETQDCALSHILRQQAAGLIQPQATQP
ncbi:MAG TPA: protein kinase [Tepidisphaeraceae bacterium]|jgi:serine/threonine protein kinase